MLGIKILAAFITMKLFLLMKMMMMMMITGGDRQQHLGSPAGAVSGAGSLPGWGLQLNESVHTTMVAYVWVVVLGGGEGDIFTLLTTARWLILCDMNGVCLEANS